MSIWQCQSCGTLTGPNPGACPKCGAATRYWHGLSYGETNTDLTVEPSVDEVAQLKAENARLRAETTRLQGALDEAHERLTIENAVAHNTGQVRELLPGVVGFRWRILQTWPLQVELEPVERPDPAIRVTHLTAEQMSADVVEVGSDEEPPRP